MRVGNIMIYDTDNRTSIAIPALVQSFCENNYGPPEIHTLPSWCLESLFCCWYQLFVWQQHSKITFSTSKKTPVSAYHMWRNPIVRVAVGCLNVTCGCSFIRNVSTLFHPAPVDFTSACHSLCNNAQIRWIKHLTCQAFFTYDKNALCYYFMTKCTHCCRKHHTYSKLPQQSYK